MPFTEDRSIFFKVSDWAYAATWSFDGSTVNVIFDAEFVDDSGFQSVGPVALANEEDFSGNLAQGQTLTIDGTIYTIKEIQPEGTGLTYIRLHDASI